MAGKYTYRANPRLAAEVQHSPEYAVGLQVVCHLIASYARQFCPVTTEAHKHLRDSIDVGLNELGVPIVFTDSFRWHWIEYGSVHDHPTPFFRRGVEAAGCVFEDRRGKAAAAKA